MQPPEGRQHSAQAPTPSTTSPYSAAANHTARQGRSAEIRLEEWPTSQTHRTEEEGEGEGEGRTQAKLRFVRLESAGSIAPRAVPPATKKNIAFVKRDMT